MRRFPASTRRRVAACFTVVTALVLVVSACSGDSGGSGSGSGDGAATVKTDADKALEFRACLRENGINAPEPEAGAGGTVVLGDGSGDSTKVEEALKACQDKAGLQAGGAEISQADKDAAVKFAQCMRKNGVDMPDPAFDGKMARAMPAPQPGAEAEKFEKASKACESTQK